MRSLLEDFFNEPFFRFADRELTGRMWPRMDIVEKKDSFVIKADLPGMNKGEFNVSIQDNVLTITGQKKEERRESDDSYAHFERSYGSFSRSFSLPDNVDAEHIDAQYRSGVLELTLKKTGEKKTRAKQVEIKGE
jgi:HSP20 family protein